MKEKILGSIALAVVSALAYMGLAAASIGIQNADIPSTCSAEGVPRLAYNWSTLSPAEHPFLSISLVGLAVIAFIAVELEWIE